MFCFLESLHTFSIVAFVVKKNGILSKAQNTLIGWGLALAYVCVCVGLQYDNYGGTYHCWLQVDKPISFYAVIGMVALVVMTFTLLEAAGAAENRRIPGKKYQYTQL